MFCRMPRKLSEVRDPKLARIPLWLTLPLGYKQLLAQIPLTSSTPIAPDPPLDGPPSRL